MKRTTINRRQQVSQVLYDTPDGMTRDELMAATGLDDSGFYATLKTLDHVYIDRWTVGRRRYGQKGVSAVWLPVYCIVPKIEDAPKPDVEPLE